MSRSSSPWAFCRECREIKPRDEFYDERGKWLGKCRSCKEVEGAECDPPAPSRTCHYPGCKTKTFNYYCDKHRPTNGEGEGDFTSYEVVGGLVEIVEAGEV